MNYFKYLLTFTLFFIVHEEIQAQNFRSEKEIENIKIHNFFSSDLQWEITPDSNMIIGFAFKISVQKNEDGQLKAISIIANDTIAFKIFSKYEFLKSINYKLFLKEKKEAIFIIPVFIDLADSGRKPTREYLMDYYTKNVYGRSMSKAVRSMFFLDQTQRNNHIENYIYLTPYIIAKEKRISNY
jgi:hypothetical protein